MKIIATCFIAALLLSGCAQDDNAKPVFSKNGLAVNCRAYVQVVIDGYRTKQYTAEESMTGLERNCGASGLAWKDLRD